MVATLGCAGLRNTELCDVNWPDLVFAHRKIRVVDSETPAGIREVAMTPRPPGVTVHTLRRTSVSLMVAAGADLRWVQAQVGHEDAKMTLDVYTQVLQRKDRDLFTEAFDRLMADAIPSGGGVTIPPKTRRSLRISRIPSS